MEGIDDVRIVQVESSSFIGDVHGMIERQIPDREGFVFRIPRLHATLVLVVELRKARCHLARARTRSRYHYERARGFDVFIPAVAFIAYDARDIVRISGDRVMKIGRDAKRFETMAERIGSSLAAVLRDDHCAHVKAHAAQDIHQAQNILVVGNAKVAAYLILFDIVSVDSEDDLDIVLHGFEHRDLCIGLEARKNA